MTSCLPSFESDVAAREQISVWWVEKKTEQTCRVFRGFFFGKKSRAHNSCLSAFW